MPSARTLNSRQHSASPAPDGLLRTISVAILLSGTALCPCRGHGAEPEQRIFPAAPTDYRRPLITPQTLPLNPAVSGNAEADLPADHLLYSLHAPPHTPVVRQAGNWLEAAVESGTVTSGVVHAGAVQEVGPTVDQPVADRLSKS